MNDQNKKRMKRRANILYRLRRKGFICDTRQRTIYWRGEWGNPQSALQVRQLRGEFHFEVQYEL
jgi:hypothetical protein